MDTDVVLAIDEDGADAERLDDLARMLRGDLLHVDEVERVQALRTGEAPPGTKAIDASAVGALLVSVRASTEVFARVLDSVRAWLGRGKGRRVEITIGDNSLVLDGASESDQARLVKAFLDKVALG